jgi:uncharacterized protein
MVRDLTVAVQDLLRQPGMRRPVRRAVTLADVAISTAALAPGAEVTVDLQVESQADSIVATGTVTLPWVGACRRCLEPVTGTAVADIREIFERRPVEGETYRLVGDLVDLAPMVHDAALLALPLAPLCATDCRGPDPESFPTTVEGESAGDAIEVEEPNGSPSGHGGDPRWSALDQLKFD